MQAILLTVLQHGGGLDLSPGGHGPITLNAMHHTGIGIKLVVVLAVLVVLAAMLCGGDTMRHNSTTSTAAVALGREKNLLLPHTRYWYLPTCMHVVTTRET